MSQNELNSEQAPARTGPSRQYPWAIVVVVVLFVVVPFISWYGTWFGRPLSDAKMLEYLHDREKPRNTQHALSLLATAIQKGDPASSRWYPEIIGAASNPTPEVRSMAAWVMGQDNHAQEFHEALLPLLNDASPIVRHNAALSLVRFGDKSARRELVAMLQPTTVEANASGSVELLAHEEGMAIAAGGPLARIRRDDGSRVEMRAAEAARLQTILVGEGSRVEAGDKLMTLLPSTDQAWEALRALFVIGEPDDIPAIQPYIRPMSGMPDRVQAQALSTIEAIRDRSKVK